MEAVSTGAFDVGALVRTVVALLLTVLMGCSPAQAPGPGAVAIALEPVVDGLENPLYVTHAGDGSGRLYVLEQPGRVRVVEGGRLLEAPFLDLTDRVLSRGNEQGLLGLAFAPDFAGSGTFYVHYTGRPDGRTVLARYRLKGGDPYRGDPDSEEVLLTVEQPYANHNGGALLFGPDSCLYLALGDGGSAGDPENRAQNLESLLGKILRLDVSQPGPYRVPPDNPFVGREGRDEIWAYGLRNPWRISFDRATGDLYIADVGQNAIEEVNFQPADSRGGENYGWRVWEGSRRYAQGEAPGAVFPVAEYTHAEGGCSITGGYVYRGKAIPGLVGTYLYGDYCTGYIWGLTRANGEWRTARLLDSNANITSFGEDEEGEVYVVDRRGTIYRIVPAG
ncbi:PQQ-dependent sugar dehydrogenase [Symbiobacterium terraclitae]|uniref:PQQ-dependent sugar dehydrogenase n=1 Tax=Symbiobacterium terraclitae TaxID=557451 RepID=UPI0035B54955